MTKSTITRERLEWLSQISCRDDIEDIGGDEIRELASMALAAMDNEPVAYTDERNLGYIDRGRETAYLWGKQNSEASDVALYRHAQPGVPDGLVKAVEFYEQVKRENPPVETGAWKDAVDRVLKEACRAAMLQASPVCTCPSGDGSLRWPCPVHAGNSPVIGIDLASGPDRTVEVHYVAPPGYVMVPKEPTEAMMLHNSGCQHHAWDDPDCAMRQTRRLIWSHMLAAAPQKVK